MASRRRGADDFRPDIDLDRLVAQAREAAKAARAAARDARDWAEPQLEHARDWAVPRAKRAYRTGARRATPYVAAAGDRAEHLADVVHDAVVTSVIPGVVNAFRRAGTEPEPERDRGRNYWPAVLIPLAVGVAAGVAIVAWARKDPGAETFEERPGESDFTREQRLRVARARTSINRAVDSAETAVHHAADMVATTAAAAGAAIVETVTPTAQRVRDAAEPIAHRVRDATVPVAQGFRETMRSTGNKARDDMLEALEDMGDVWGDDDDSDSPSGSTTTKPAARKPSTTKKPAAKKKPAGE